MAFVKGLQGVLGIAIMLSIGYCLAHKGWLDENISGVFSKILMNVSIPCLMISNLLGNFNKDKLLGSGTGLLIAYGTILISLLTGTVLSRIIKVDKSRLGAFRVMFAFSNTMFIGLPVTMALFEEDGVPYLLLYYLANTSLFWTIGNHIVRSDSRQSRPIFTKEGLKNIFTPPLITFMAGLVMVILNIKLPAFLMDVSKYMANLNTPMSMLMIGTIIHSIGIKGIKFDREMIGVMAGRFIVTPLLVVTALRLLPVPDLMGKVFIIQSAMPVMAQTAVSARAYNGDYRYASSAITVTTIASLIFIPFYMYLMG